MMKKIFLDPGHGGKDPGAVSKGLQEKHLTLTLATHVRRELFKKAPHIKVKMSRTKDETVSLAKRVRLANQWKADLFLSLHINAGGGTGYEDFIHTSLKETSKTAQLRSILHEEVVKRNQLFNRGKKRANFYVLRKTRMPAILTENGFIDSPSDRKLLQSKKWVKQTASGFTQGIVRAFKLQKKTATYYIVAGSFKHLVNAKRQKQRLKSFGYDCFIDVVYLNRQKLYRIIAGDFSEFSKAKKHQATLQAKGISTFITS